MRALQGIDDVVTSVIQYPRNTHALDLVDTAHHTGARRYLCVQHVTTTIVKGTDAVLCRFSLTWRSMPLYAGFRY